MRLRIWQLIGLAGLLLLAACSASGAGSGAANGAGAGSDKPVSGGTATFSSYQELSTLDPAKATFGISASLFMPNIFDTLVVVSPNGTIEPRLATSATSPDGKAWTVKLRPNVKFSDGTSLDATAVIGYWKRLADPQTASPTFRDAATIVSARALSPLTIKVTLNAPNGQFPRLLMAGLGTIPSPTAVAREGASFATAPVGAGPFVVKEWVQDDHLTLVRNPHYWNAPEPYLNQVVIRPINDDQQRLDTVTTGGAQLAAYPVWSPGLVQARDQKMNVVMASWDVGGQVYFFNAARAPFNDVNLRRAFLLAADVNAVNESVDQGKADFIQTLFPKGSPFYVSSIRRPAPDLKTAQSLVDAYIAQHGPITVNMFDATENKALAEAFQQQWSQLKGVKVNLQLVEANNLIRTQGSGQFNVIASSMFGADPEPQFDSRLHTNGTLNTWGFSDPVIDRAADQGRESLTLAGRVAAYKTLQTQFWKDVPAIPESPEPYAVVTGNGVHGLTLIAQGEPDLSGVWLAH